MTTLTFLGGAQRVTGSCYLIDTGKHRVLLECGLRQGGDRGGDELQLPFDFEPARIDAVVLSHTHLDHCGLVPLLVAGGYSGPVFSTSAARDLLPIMWFDAASLLRSDYERQNRRLMRAGKKELELPYTDQDVQQALDQVVGVPYAQREQILPELALRFVDAGHILGSAIVELWLGAQGKPRKLVFSGDLGNSCAPLMKDPAVVQEADVLLMESTYGDRDHRPLDDTLEEFKEVIEEAAQQSGNILIPSFAVGRTQDMIYWLGQLFHEGRLNNRKVFIDSPMAIKVSDVYERHSASFNHDDPRFNAFIGGGWDSWLPGLTYTPSPEESMALNRISEGAIIIAGSGMCTGGRILHHLKHNLWRRNNQVVIVGYQAEGTLGRALVDGAKSVRIFGDEIAVRAKIHTLGGFSAHAGQSQLLEWAAHFHEPRPRLYLVHGEPDSMQVLQQQFVQRFGWQAAMPQIGERIEI